MVMPRLVAAACPAIAVAKAEAEIEDGLVPPKFQRRRTCPAEVSTKADLSRRSLNEGGSSENGTGVANAHHYKTL